MPTHKELTKAWTQHDELEDSDKTKDCSHFPGYNKTMGHSHFNTGCIRWAQEYAIRNPIERIIIQPAERSTAGRIVCSICGRSVKEEYSYELEVGGVVCGKKCEKRMQRRLRIKAAEEAEKARQDALMKQLKEKGMIELKSESTSNTSKVSEKVENSNKANE